MFWFVSLFVTLTTAELTVFRTDDIMHTLRESNENVIRRRSPRPYAPAAAARASERCVAHEWARTDGHAGNARNAWEDVCFEFNSKTQTLQHTWTWQEPSERTKTIFVKSQFRQCFIMWTPLWVGKIPKSCMCWKSVKQLGFQRSSWWQFWNNGRKDELLFFDYVSVCSTNR